MNIILYNILLNPQESTAKVSTKVFSNAEVQEGKVQQFVKDHVYIQGSGTGDPPIVYGTGAHASFLRDKLSKELGVRYIVFYPN